MSEKMEELSSITKVYWKNIRNIVAQVEPTFAKLVDELDPDKNFPLFLTYFPYGVLKGDTQSSFIPRGDGTYYRLNDPNAPSDIKKHLGYGIGNAPFAMLLEKSMESFIDIKDIKVTIPVIVYKPGDVFPFARILNKSIQSIHAPNGILSLASGARSVCMIPNIGCHGNHLNLQREYHIQSPAPKRLYDHWQVFGEIAKNNTNWRSCLLYFSQNWLDQLHDNPAWSKLKLYLHELAWRRFEYDRTHINYEVAYSVIQRKRNLKPSPYLADTAKHLLAIAVANHPAFAPACDERALPTSTIQHAYINSYNLTKQIPTIMQPTVFDSKNKNEPVYYSIPYPTTLSFSPKARKTSSILFELYELAHILKHFQNDISDDDFMCYQTIMNSATKHISFEYFHNEFDPMGLIKPSNEIVLLDKRFELILGKDKMPQGKFASDAPFLRGCVGIYAS